MHTIAICIKFFWRTIALFGTYSYSLHFFECAPESWTLLWNWKKDYERKKRRRRRRRRRRREKIEICNWNLYARFVGVVRVFSIELQLRLLLVSFGCRLFDLCNGWFWRSLYEHTHQGKERRRARSLMMTTMNDTDRQCTSSPLWMGRVHMQMYLKFTIGAGTHTQRERKNCKQTHTVGN